MMAFEYNFQGQSKIYYMESEDSVHFTYRDYSSCVKSKDIINRNTLQTHGYPDFVCNPLGHVDTETVYCAYMEGKMADSGNDWRQYSATWDIHIAAFNPKEFANREIVLPNNRVYNEKDIIKTRIKNLLELRISFINSFCFEGQTQQNLLYS